MPKPGGDDPGPAKAGTMMEMKMDVYLAMSAPIRVADLPTRKPHRFALDPDGAARAQLATLIGVDAVRALSFRGEIRPRGRDDFMLDGVLRAEVVQPCVVTLAPVTSRIEERVTRRYLARMPEPEAPETEMPEDDSIEPLGEAIDPGAVAAEALALALPPYPRAPEADAEAARLGIAADDAPDAAGPTHRPFAVLEGLRKRMDAGGDSGTES